MSSTIFGQNVENGKHIFFLYKCVNDTESCRLWLLITIYIFQLDMNFLQRVNSNQILFRFCTRDRKLANMVLFLFGFPKGFHLSTCSRHSEHLGCLLTSEVFRLFSHLNVTESFRETYVKTSNKEVLKQPNISLVPRITDLVEKCLKTRFQIIASWQDGP